ncbi:MAG TPA: phosphohydrolase, partial [Trueperaceae bacterium]
NHDYWWSAIGKIRAALPEGMYALQNDALELDGLVVAGTRGWTVPGSSNFGPQDEKVYSRELERLRLSLRAAAQLPGRRRVVMLHYPPTNFKLEPSGFTELIRRAAPDALVFGHLHGEDGQRVIRELDDIAVYYVAADALRFTPQLIFESV